MNARLNIILQLSIAVFVIGCSAQFERWIDSPYVISDAPDTEYIVKKNDTLYAIAWLYNLSYHDLAEWNGVKPPKYIIYPGQHLRLSAPAEQATQIAQQDSKPASDGATRTQARSQPKTRVKPKPPAAKPQARTTRQRSRAPKPQAVQSYAVKSQAKAIRWQWPLAKMSKPISYRRGVRIRGLAGQPVRAVASGIVVYSGFDLKHYEGLIIVKHPGDFFSAYGFVGKIKVKEGVKVKSGQIIAHLPSHKDARLYFDLRHRGTRLNPLKYMPKLS